MPSLRSLASMRLRCGTLRPSVSLITSCEIGRSNAVSLGAADHQQPRVELQQEVGEPLDRRAAADIDDALGIERGVAATASQLSASANFGRR